MPVLSAATVSEALKSELHRAMEMNTFVVRNVPDSFKGDTDEKILVGGYFSLILEHHGAILYLLQSGQFDGSALALVRPLIDAAYRAHWVTMTIPLMHPRLSLRLANSMDRKWGYNTHRVLLF
jgi:hypothetical protein